MSRRPPAARDEALLLGAALLLAIVLLLAVAVRMGWTAAVDAALLGAPAALVTTATLVTRLGDAVTRIVIAAVVAGALWLLGERRPALFVAAAVIVGSGWNQLLKWGFARDRPDLLPQLDQVRSSSFPSGHAAGSAELWLALALVAVRLGAPARAVWGAAALLIGAIGASRVALAVHWPSDVLAGWCAGAAWVLLCAEGLAIADRGKPGRA